MDAAQAWTVPDTQYVWANESRVFAIEWPGTEALSSPLNTCYQNLDDVSATVLTGSTSVSGRIQTAKTFAASSATGGETYIMYFTITKGAQTLSRAMMIKVLALGTER